MLHNYGRALLEHIISVSGALNCGDTRENINSDETALKANKSALIGFNDGPLEDEDEEETKTSTGKRKANEESEEKAATQEEEEEEDDMGVAFTVLDLSRVILEHLLDGSSIQDDTVSKGKGAFTPTLHLVTGERWGKKEIEAELAEVRNDLGDIGLETGMLSIFNHVRKL